MNTHQAFVGIAFGAAAIIVLVYATQNDGPMPMHVPDIQTEAQFSALGLGTGFNVQAAPQGSIQPEAHFWAPGFNGAVGFGDNTPLQPVPTQHRYPALPGANLTAVMHHGWSSLNEPKCNEWFRNPPSAAVL